MGRVENIKLYGFKVGGDSQSQKDFLPTPIIKYQLDNSGIKTTELCNGNQPKGEHEASFPLSAWEKIFFYLGAILG